MTHFYFQQMYEQLIRKKNCNFEKFFYDQSSSKSEQQSFMFSNLSIDLSFSFRMWSFKHNHDGTTIKIKSGGGTIASNFFFFFFYLSKVFIIVNQKDRLSFHIISPTETFWTKTTTEAMRKKQWALHLVIFSVFILFFLGPPISL